MTPEELAERRSELDTYWAAEAPLRRRSTIEVFPLPQVPDSDVIHGTLIRATHDDELREIAQDFGRMFKQELRFDSPPFRTSYEQGAQEVYLIKSKRVLMLSPVACGAVGFEPALNHLEWIWIHPFDRGKGLIDRAWDALEMLYGSEFTLEQPVSPFTCTLPPRSPCTAGGQPCAR